MMTREEAKFKLEILVDWFGAGEVLSMMGDVLYEKGTHLRENWQNVPLARSWERDARKVNNLFEKIEN